MGIVAWTFTKSDIWLRLTRSATAVYPTADSPAGCTTGTLCISRLREMFTLEMDPRTPLLDPRSSTGQVGRSCLLDPLLLLPHFMSLQKERLDLPFVAASRQFPIPQRPASVTAALWSAWSSYPQASCQRHRGLVVGMVLIPTDHALEALLGAPIGAIHIMTAGALLGRVRSADGVGGHTLFGRGPGQLLWDMPQLGSIQIRVHGTSMEAHGGQHSDPHK